MSQRKRFFNLRFFFIGFLGMILGILTFSEGLKQYWLNETTAWLVLMLILFFAVIALTVFFIVKKDFRKYLKFAIIFILMAVTGFGLFSLKWNDLKKYPVFSGKQEVVGIVKNFYVKGNSLYFNLEKVEIGGVKVKGNLTLYAMVTCPISDDLSLGDEIAFTGKVALKSLITDKINITQYVNNNVYSSTGILSDVTIRNKKPSAIYFLQTKLKNALSLGLTNENADIAYGALVGDKEGLSADVTNMFSYAGISHILAVSGLHVGFLVGMLTLILNIFKCGRKTRFGIISAILIFYSIFCNLAPSILRATIMSIILLLAGVIGEEYDGLNALGFAGLLILLIFPLDLFSLGFQLSFMCVFMIITLGDKTTKILTGWKVPSKLASAICISFCVTLGSSIIVANSMGQVSLISIVANLFVIPLFGVTYPLLFLFATLCIIMPFLSPILYIPELLLHGIKLLANFFAGINFAHFRIFHLGYLLLFIFILMSLFGKFFMANKYVKIPIISTLAVTCVGLTIFGVLPKKYNEAQMFTYHQFDTVSSVFTTRNGEKYLLGHDKYYINGYLTDLKISTLDAWILPEFEVNKIDNYLEFLDTVKIKNLIIPYDNRYTDAVLNPLRQKCNVIMENEYRKNDFFVNFLVSDMVLGTIIEIDNCSILFPIATTKVKLEPLSSMLIFREFDYVVINDAKYRLTDYLRYDTLIHHNTLVFEHHNSISLENNSHFVLEIGG